MGLVLLLVVAGSGCDLVYPFYDDGAPSADPEAQDASLRRLDGSVVSDGETDVDSGVVDDSGVWLDGGVRLDSGVVKDSGARVDSSVAKDSGARVDSSVAEDSGEWLDSSVAEDSGAMVDACLLDAGPQTPPLEGWFVDAMTGNDDINDGRSERTPFSTFARLLRSPIESGTIVYLARGSMWREELTDLPAGTEVRAYGKGARPIIDGSDVAPNESFQKTADMENVYEIAWLHDFGPDGGKTAHRAWEDGTRMRRVPDLASCDATPGSFYAPSPSATGVDTIYVHASDSSPVSTNGKLYELTKRRWALQLYAQRDHAAVYSVHTRRNAHADGSLVVDGLVSDCLAEDGRVHNVSIRGIAEDTTAWKIEPPVQYGGATMFVTFEDLNDLPGVTYRRCHAIADADALGPNGAPNSALTLGFFGHTTGGKRFGTALYEECDATGVIQGFGFQQVDTTVYYKCQTDGGQIAIGSYPTQTLAVLGGTYRSQTTANASFLRYSNDYGVPETILVRGVRAIIDGDYNAPIWIDRAGGSIEISRSTFIQNGGGKYSLTHGSFVVENSIFVGGNFTVRLSSSGVSYTADHNLFFETTGAPAAFQFDTTTNISGLPDWRSATGQDLESIDADPQFLGSPVLGEFDVAATSPVWALGAGADYEGEEDDATLQAYRATFSQGAPGVSP